MSNFSDRSNTALVVIDVQNAVVGDAHDRDAVVERIAGLVAKARAESVPVVWVQHSSDELPSGSEPWQIVPELQPTDSETLVHKEYGDSFEATTLEEELAGLGVGRLFITGAQSDACVRSTLHGAFVRGYDTMLVGDAHTTEDLSQWGAPPPDKVIAHTNLYWSFHAAPGREAGTVPSAQVDFA